MKQTFLYIFCIIVSPSYAQLFKPSVKPIRTHLDSVYTDAHFRYETLDSVYRYFSEEYNIVIHYDTAYCRRHHFSYWYMNTPVSLALHATTYQQRLTCYIDSSAVVYIKRRGRLQYEDTVSERLLASIKYEGAPVKKHFSLSGKVVDFNSGTAITNAILTLPTTGQIAEVNSEGYFTFADVASDTVAISVVAQGYIPTEVYLTPDTRMDNYIIEMEENGKNMLEDVVVVAYTDVSLQNRETISTLQMSAKKLSELPNVGEKDIMRAMQLLPGVSAAHESSSGLYVRGGTPDQNLVLYDGFTVYHVDHLYGFFSAFNSNALKDMQLYKGGFDAKYGGRISSVSELTGKEADHKRFNMGGDVSLLSGNVFMEIPVSQKISLSAAARRSWKGPIYNWIFNKFGGSDADANQSSNNDGRGPQTKTNSYFSDINTKLVYNPSADSKIAFSYFTGNDFLENTQTFGFGGFGGGGGFGGNNATDKTKYANRGTSLQWAQKWNRKLKSNNTISYSNYFSDRNRTNARYSIDSVTNDTTTVYTGVIEKNNLKDYSFRSDWTWGMSRHNQIELGAFATVFDIHYSYGEDDTSIILNRNDKGTLSGLFLQDRFRFFKDRAELKAGMRMSYFNVTAKTYTEPRLAASYKISNPLSLRLAYGQYYQFANQITREDVLAGNKEFWILSDGANVPVSQSTHYIAGLNYESKDYLFSAEGYYKSLTDITQYSLRFSSVRSDRSYSENFYTGKGFARGIELMAQKKSGKITGWISYAFGQARNQFDVYGADYFPASQDVTNELKIVGIYKYKKWDFSATWVWATGRPYTAPGGSYTITLLDGTTKDYFTVTSQNSLRLPDYHRLDIAANRHFYNEKGEDVGYLGISVFNAYNRTNVWYKQYYINDGSITEANVNYLGITPNITLSIKLH